MHTITRRIRAATLAGAALALSVTATAAAPAYADRAVTLLEDNYGVVCEARADGLPQVSFWVHREATSGEAEAGAEVHTPDGEGHVASGYTDQLVLAGGVVSARFPLTHEDGSPAGEVVLEGTWTGGTPDTTRGRIREGRNGAIMTETTWTPLTVSWSTVQVGDFALDGLSCFGDRIESRNKVLSPHRLVLPSAAVELTGDCTTGPLTSFEIGAAEVGTSLWFGVPGWSGGTNLNLTDGADTGIAEWYAEDGASAYTAASATLTETGPAFTVVRHSDGATVRERVQPMRLSYDLSLPGGLDPVSGSCAAQSVQRLLVVEPLG